MNRYKTLTRLLSSYIRLAAGSAFVAFTMTAPTQPFDARPSGVSRLAWLTGCWVEDLGVLKIEDEWTSPVGHSILGVSRVLQGDSVVGFELRAISDTSGRFMLTMISNAGRQTMSGDSVTTASVDFLDSTSTRLRSISYRSEAPNQLVVRRERLRGGKLRALDELFDRASCDAMFRKVLR